MVLEVENLNNSFRHPWNLKRIQVLFDVSFRIESKSIVGFLGGNGAGKTTTIKSLIGLLTYETGRLQIFGKHHLAKRVKQLVGYLPERPYFYNYLTANEFLRFYGQLSSMNGSELNKRIDELLELVGLSHAKNLYLNQFSKGMLQRVGLAQALIHRPKLLILDEPLSGLDPDGRRQLVQIIQNTFDHEDTTVFFSSHLLDDIDRLCRDLVLIKGGKIHYNGPKSRFVENSERPYLIKYQNGDEALSESVAHLVNLQSRIDELRHAGHAVLHIEQEKVSLDQAFQRFQQSEGTP